MLNRRAVILTIIGFFACFFIGSTPAYADEDEETTSPIIEGSSTLEIKPVSKRMSLKAGEPYSSSINVTNNGDTPITIHVYATPFSVNEDGETQDFEEQTSYTQISRWILIKTSSDSYEAMATYTLIPHETKDIGYTVKVPEEVPGGGQYAVIFVESTPEVQPEEGIQTISRAGMTIYATMPGEPKRSTHIKDIEVKSINLDGEIAIKSYVENDGNIDFQVSTNINVYSIFGKQLYSSNSLSPIFPESSKTIYLAWNDSPSFGVYRVDYSIDALDVHAKGSQVILVLTPITLVLTVIIATATITAIVSLIKHRHSKDKDAPTISIG